jgi:tripartite-type tricarboxylate transporter receptor subunit TctC
MKLLFVLLHLLMMAQAFTAQAQNFPNKTVRIIVPFPPAGGADTLARVMAPQLSALWGQQVVIENKPGASGHIGADYVAQSLPDGHTLLMASTAALNEKNTPQFASISLVSASSYVVTVNATLGVSTIRELVAMAKANPGKLSFGSSGAGSASHLTAELFKAQAGVDLLHVPYKGTGQALSDLVSGQISLMFAPAQTVMQHVQAGRLKALAVTSSKRSAIMPLIPTVAESSVPNYAAVGWFGLLAPAATPKAVINKISADASKVLTQKETRDKLIALGSEPESSSPEAFAIFIKEDQAKWAKLMREQGIKGE